MSNVKNRKDADSTICVTNPLGTGAPAAGTAQLQTEGGDARTIVNPVTKLLEAQCHVMELQVQALASPSIPLLRKFTGENVNTRCTVRMLPGKEKDTYEKLVIALQKRFRSLDIHELHGLEFHQLMQEGRSIEELGVELQRKAFPVSSTKEFDHILKGTFHQALLPKWQKKARSSITFRKLNCLLGAYGGMS